MTHTIRLLPGHPDDDNRDYLPQALQYSDVVVNENGNNSQPYPRRLQEFQEPLIDDQSVGWYVYVPESYRPGQAVPLVVSLHGGLMTGWGQAVYTSWTQLAEREGFIVLFPDASSRRLWTIDIAEEFVEQATTPNPSGIYLDAPAQSAEQNQDNRLILALIERTAADFSIDRSRVYIQGMSMGNVMSDQFTRHFGDRLAGASGSGGPSALGIIFDADGSPVNEGGPVPVWLTTLELDTVPPFTGGTDREVIRGNRDYWLAVNGVRSLPEISIVGQDNFAFYTGDHADVVVRDVKNRDHGQTFDDAELVWDHLFSGTRRSVNGDPERVEPLSPRRGDSFSIAVAAGGNRAWLNNEIVDLGGRAFIREARKYHGLGGDVLVRGEYVFVPLSFAATAFNATLEPTGDGRSCLMVLPDGRELGFTEGSIGCVIDGRIRSMLSEAVHRDDELWVSLEWLSAFVLDLRVSQCEGVIYVTDHHSLLSKNMAHLIQDLLMDGRLP